MSPSVFWQAAIKVRIIQQLKESAVFKTFINNLFKRYQKQFPELSNEFNLALKTTIFSLLKKDNFYNNAAVIVAEKLIDKLHENKIITSNTTYYLMFLEKSRSQYFAKTLGMTTLDTFVTSFNSVWDKNNQYFFQKYPNAGTLQDSTNVSLYLSSLLTFLLWQNEILNNYSAVLVLACTLLITQAHQFIFNFDSIAKLILGTDFDIFLEIHNELYKITKLPEIKNLQPKSDNTEKDQAAPPSQYLEFNLETPNKEPKKEKDENNYQATFWTEPQPSKKALKNQKNRIKKAEKNRNINAEKEEEKKVKIAQSTKLSFDSKLIADALGFEDIIFPLDHPHLPENTYLALIHPDVKIEIDSNVLKKFEETLKKGKFFIGDTDQQGVAFTGSSWMDTDKNLFLCHELKILGYYGNHRLYGAEIEKNIDGKNYRFIIFNTYDDKAHQPGHFAHAIENVFSKINKSELMQL